MSEIMIKPLTPDMAEDYAHFFDVTPHDDGTDKEELPCYCVTWRGDESYEGNTDHWFATREQRREKAIGFVKSGALQGYLAYMDEEIVGWCNANANCRYCRDYLRSMWNIDEYDPAVKIKSVFCFMIAPQAQKKGVATKLLQRVCADATADGFDFVEAHVYEGDKAGPYDFTGPIALYEKCGFIRYTVKDQYVVMRKILAVDPYTHCPTFESERFLLRLLEPSDAEDLFAVYTDPAAQDILNECSAWNCDFGYGPKDLAAMQDYIRIWLDAYKNRFFVRMTILDKQNQRIVGTMEAFRSAGDAFCGDKICLRVDIHSDYENDNAFDELLSLMIKDGIKTFGADGILTRVTPTATKRLDAMVKNGFVLSDKTLLDFHGWGVTYRDFWVKMACNP